MADTLKTYSVLIAWDDDDQEKGQFGDIVRARNSEEAEAMVRANMRENHIAEYCEVDSDDDEINESCAAYESTDLRGNITFGGSVLDCHEGAIWKAAELETTLRRLLAAADETAARCGWSDHGEREAARELIAEIDGI